MRSCVLVGAVVLAACTSEVAPANPSAGASGAAAGASGGAGRNAGTGGTATPAGAAGTGEPRDAAELRDAAIATRDAAAPDASPALDAVPARRCGATMMPSSAVTVAPRRGNATDAAFVPQGPGLVLMGGGTDVDAAFVWMHDVIAGVRTGNGGDVVVLRATGTNAYDAYIAGLASFHSVRTFVIGPSASAADLAAVATHVDCAEAVWFAGGDQADYVRWKDTPLFDAVDGVHARGGVVGGTSAGLAIAGEHVYDARTGSVTTDEAVRDPYHRAISFTANVLHLPLLAGVITDSHFGARDRMGRLAVFMARLLADGTIKDGRVLGLGVDEGTALVVDARGMGSGRGSGSAYLVVGGPASRASRGQPIAYRDLTVERLRSGSGTYDLTKRCGTGARYTLAVDGSASPPYAPPSPYTALGSPGICD